MKANPIYTLVLCCILLVGSAEAQQGKTIDSLKSKLRAIDKLPDSYSRDIAYLNTYNRLALQLRTSNPKQARNYAEKGLELARNNKLVDYEADALLLIGNCWMVEGKVDKSKAALLSCLIIAEREGMQQERAGCYLSLAGIYKSQGSYSSAIEFYQKAQKIYKELGNKETLGVIYANIGDIYWIQHNYTPALENIQKALEINEELDNRANISINLSNISSIYFNQHYYAQALEYAQKALAMNVSLGNVQVIAQSYTNVADIYTALNNNTAALDYYKQALDAYEEKSNDVEEVAIYLKIGDIYAEQDNVNAALDWYGKGIKEGKALRDNDDVAQCYYNVGEIYQKQGRYSQALEEFQNALKISERSENKRLVNYTCIKIGQIYSKQGKQDVAIDWLQRGAQMADKLGSANELGVAKTDLINAYIARGDYRQAEKYLKQGWSIVRVKGDKMLKRDYAGSYSQFAAKTGDWQSAYEYQKISRANADSLVMEETIRKEMEYRFGRKQDSLKLQQRIQQATYESELMTERIKSYATLAGLVLVLAGMILLFRQRQKTRRALKRSDELLLNILPGQVALELKETGVSEAKSYDSCTVLFADIKDFTKISEQIGALELVAQMDIYFRGFDRIIAEFGVEKIKTIGDAYMCAGGLPLSNETHAQDVVRVALAMQNFIREQDRVIGSNFEFRIGIHTGPVVAGIVGVKKFAYDIWGDTVNTAARMEQAGQAGEINISATTYELIKDEFECIPRGAIKVKGKGELAMYFVKQTVKPLQAEIEQAIAQDLMG